MGRPPGPSSQRFACPNAAVPAEIPSGGGGGPRSCSERRLPRRSPDVRRAFTTCPLSSLTLSRSRSARSSIDLLLVDRELEVLRRRHLPCSPRVVGAVKLRADAVEEVLLGDLRRWHQGGDGGQSSSASATGGVQQRQRRSRRCSPLDASRQLCSRTYSQASLRWFTSPGWAERASAASRRSITTRAGGAARTRPPRGSPSARGPPNSRRRQVRPS